MSERETDRTAPWMLNHCANLKHGTVQSGVLVSACDWCAKYADPLCAMARPGGPDDHDWPAGCSCARRHNVAAPVVSRAAGGETAKVCQCGGEPCIGPAMLRPGYYCSQAHRMNARIGVNGAWCYDCGLAYGTSGFADLVVPNEVWNTAISPTNDEGGLLCPTCLVARASNAGVRCEAVFRSGPFAARALSSAPAPEERHRRFAEAVNARISYDVQDSTVYVEFKSPRDAVAFEEAMRGCDRHPDPDFRPASSSPSGAGSPVAHRWERCSECGPMVICGHCGNNCCNGGSGDNCPDRCASAYAEQKAGWARLNASKAWHPAPPAAGREPSELLDAARALVERIDLIHANDDYRGVWSLAFAHGHRYAGPTYEAELARLRAALGASAQTNTGEGR